MRGKSESTTYEIQARRVGYQWKMQRTAQGLLADRVPRATLAGAVVQGYRYRVCMCMRGKLFADTSITLRRSPDHTRAEYRGVQTCGSVWHCPICAPKVAAERRDELHMLLHLWTTGGRLASRGIERLDGQPWRDARGSGVESRRQDRRCGAELVIELQLAQLGEDRRCGDRRAGDRRCGAERRQRACEPDRNGIVQAVPLRSDIRADVRELMDGRATHSDYLTEPRSVRFVTYTFSHAATSRSIAEQADLFKEALKRLKKHRAYISIMRAAGFGGEVKGQEVTYGEANGWHPHAHSILLTGERAAADRALSRLRRVWARVLLALDREHREQLAKDGRLALLHTGLTGLRAGDFGAARFRKLRNLLEHCCVVQDGSYAAAYVNKFGLEPISAYGGRWGLGSEMTQAHLKLKPTTYDALPRRCGHASVWELLADATDGDQRSAALWREYARAYHGRAQLFFSPGLKGRMGLQSWSDHHLAAEPDKRCSEYVMQLGSEDWTTIIRHDARWQALTAAASEGREGVLLLLERLRARPPTHSGAWTEGQGWAPRKAQPAQ